MSWEKAAANLGLKRNEQKRVRHLRSGDAYGKQVCVQYCPHQALRALCLQAQPFEILMLGLKHCDDH